MRSLISALRRNRLRTAMWATLALLVLVGAFAATARATDQSSFCTSCHEMTPYYAAWTEGPHAGVACIECHVDAGTAERMAHKVTALGEVVGHFFGDPTFPMGTTEVPDERCLACHDGVIETDLPGFVHADHAEGKACITCHASAGHDVTAEALAEAGVLDPEAQAAKDAREVAVVGGGAANLEGHAPVSCSTCHDMAATGCASCHEPGHEPRDPSTTCTDCHSAATRWAFAHPVRTDCATCHEAPAEHFQPECATCHTPGAFTFTHPAAGTSCTTCHERPAEHRSGACETCHSPGASWVFAHPGADADCASCHTKPARHYNGTCNACHTPGKPFKSTVFKHPGASANCATCHAAPAKHYPGSCNACHSPGTAFRSAVFQHPGASATCTSCHSAPSGHRGGSCTTCHRPAASWAFYHPASTDCASCHGAPAGHYAGACSSCHSAGKPFASAVFQHPGASANCASCHGAPAGHPGGACATCHRPAASWAFYHPTSTSCASCHAAPANHYGTACSSCHTPSVAWRSATFSHPGIRGGEHTYRSFSCTTCHPGGYSSYSCLQCHDSNDPDD